MVLNNIYLDILIRAHCRCSHFSGISYIVEGFCCTIMQTYFHHEQMVQATQCEVGCALAECPDLDIPPTDDYYYFLNLLSDDYSDVAMDTTPYLVVCKYGPSYSESLRVTHRPPYKEGKPCSQCPRQYPLCNRTQHYGYNTSLDGGEKAQGNSEERFTPGLCCKSTKTHHKS